MHYSHINTLKLAFTPYYEWGSILCPTSLVEAEGAMIPSQVYLIPGAMSQTTILNQPSALIVVCHLLLNGEFLEVSILCMLFQMLG